MPDQNTTNISRETFEELEPKSQASILFDLAVATLNKVEKLDEKTEKLEKTAMKWGSAGGVVSAIGAFLAYLFVGHITK